MKWLFALVLGLILMASPSMYSQDGFTANEKFVVPNQTIIGAEEPIPTGEIVVLKISPIDAKNKPQFLKEIRYQWTVFKNGKKFDRFIPWPDNSTLVFGSGNDTRADIKVLLSIAYRYEVTEDVKDKDGKVTGKKITESAMRLAQIKVAQVKVGTEPNPPPGPDPDPINPTPAPVFPPGKYGLSKIVYDAASLVNLDSTSKQRSATALANNYKGIASSIRAGAIKSPQDALIKTKDGNGAALKSVSVVNSSWEPWDVEVQRMLDKFNKVDKTLATVQDIATAWDEISAGLMQVK